MVKIIVQMSSTIKSNVWKWDVEPEWNRLSENWLSETASYPWADTAQRSSLWWYYCSNTLQHYRICSTLIPPIYLKVGLKPGQAISRSSKSDHIKWGHFQTFFEWKGGQFQKHNSHASYFVFKISAISYNMNFK